MLKVDWLDRLTFREIEMVNEVRFSLRNLYFIALFSKPIIELESFPFTHKCVRVIITLTHLGVKGKLSNSMIGFENKAIK